MAPTDTYPEQPAVLLVDDHAPNLVALEGVLMPLGARLVTAESGETALRQIDQNEFALVLLDLRMPGLSGLETIRLVAERHAGYRPPIILVTAHALERRDLETAYRLGAVDVLQKPLAIDALRAKVAVFVELFRQRELLRQKDAELLAREKERFEKEIISIVSHDLRNPLNAISLATDLLVGTDDEERRLKAVQHIRSSTARATRLISDLLDYTRARNARSLHVHCEPADLHDVIRKALEELRLEHQMQPIAHEAHGAGSGVFDADRMTQVVTNLVTNAVRHGARGRPITVRSAQNADRLELEVHNWGEPIDDQTRQQLFEPLQQGRGAQRSAKQGLGLGLFIVERIAHAHGGSVTLSSTAGEGTLFRVLIPRHAARGNEQG